MNRGMVFDIQRASLNDGPGIRTTVFLKGCPLQCVWCHNPESISSKPQLGFFQDRCTLCGECVEACPNHVHEIINDIHQLYRHQCDLCGACVSACPNGALVITGQKMSVEDVMSIVVKDKAYYEKSGGGITLSGGEPLQQARFALAVLKAAKREGIHTCVDTSGFVFRKVLENILDFTDIFLYDYKASEWKSHLKYVGRDNDIIKDNLGFLHNSGKDIILRCPLVPGLNDESNHLQAIAELEKQYPGLLAIQLLPYHTMGSAKYQKYGMSKPGPDIRPKEQQEMKEIVAWFHEQGCPKVML